MRRKMLYLLAIAAVSMGFISSCGHDSPQGEEPVTNGGPSGGNSGGNSSSGDGHRPGLDEFDQYDRELKDDVLRVKGRGVDLRYDRGGVLFASDKGGGIRVVDLDGADEIFIRPGTEGTDSLMTETELIVNYETVLLEYMKKMRLRDGRIWYKAADSAGNDWVLVLPVR